MTANCGVLIPEYSSVGFTGIILGREGDSYLAVEFARKLAPIQNGATSGKHIADLCCRLFPTPHLGAASAGRRVSKRHPVQGGRTT